MILHAIYDHGKVTFKEKKLPQIKTQIEVVIEALGQVEGAPKNKAVDILKHPARGIWKDRSDIKDTVKWVNKTRRKENNRSRAHAH